MDRGLVHAMVVRAPNTFVRYFLFVWTIASCLPAPSHASDRAPFGFLVAEDVDFMGTVIDRIHLGAWLDASYQDSSRRGDNSNLAINHVNGFLDVRMADNWQVFIESEIEYRPDLAGFERESEIELEQAYLDYGRSDALHLRVGSFSTPFGYWTPVHWSIQTDTVAPPLYEGRRYIPEQQLGARVHGGKLFALADGLDVEASYSLFAGYGSSTLHSEKARGLTGGGDLRLGLEERGFVGVSLYTQENEERRDRREVSAIAYAELNLPYRFTLRGEYVTQRSELGDRYRHAAYGKVRWHFLEDVYLNYRLERADDEEFGPRSVQWAHRFTIGYWPTPRIRLKAEYARHELRHSTESDFSSFALWLGIFF